MADFTRRRWATRPKLNITRRMVDEEIHPSSGWTNDFPGFHCLLVNLPGFNEDDIKLNVDESGIVVVSGRRKVDDEKQEHFEKSFNVPEDGDVNNIIKIFDGATLRVRIPKVPKQETRKPSSADGASTNNINTDENDTNKPEKEAEIPTPSNGTNGAEINDASGSETNEKNEIATADNSIKENKGKISDTSVTSDDIEEKKEVPSKSTKEDVNTKKADKKQQELTRPKPDENTKKLEENEPKLDDQGKRSPDQEEKSSKASVLVKIAENKGILLASIISFTLGVLLSHKMHPSPT